MSYSLLHQPDRRLALVIGGGGAVGNAWAIGVIAGLAEAGLDLTQADLVVGTSSGSTTAAQVGSGVPPAQLLDAILSAPAGTVGGRPASPPSSMDAVFDRLRAIGAAATSAAELARALGAYGLECDAALADGVAPRRALVAARLPSAEWPERPMIVAAVNAHTGELTAFTRESGVELVDAITASTAMPGLGPTHDIDGVHYVNGGVRSAENADLAAGYANVVVLSPVGGDHPAGLVPAARFEGLRRFPDTELSFQLELLRSQGSHVELITADDASWTAMGANHMDLASRIPSARAGHTQGVREAARLTGLL